MTETLDGTTGKVWLVIALTATVLTVRWVALQPAATAVNGCVATLAMKAPWVILQIPATAGSGCVGPRDLMALWGTTRARVRGYKCAGAGRYFEGVGNIA